MKSPLRLLHGQCWASEWLFYEPAIGATNNVCFDVGATPAPTNINLNQVPFPSGTFNLGFKVNGVNGCTYTGNSNAPGILNCPDFTIPQECQDDGDDGTIFNCYEDHGVLQVVPKVYCSWE
jgi:hypothetical protein